MYYLSNVFIEYYTDLYSTLDKGVQITFESADVQM